MLECDRQQACAFAGRFLSMEPPETVDDVVRDVLGELANMIGGNLKCVLAGGLRLSMPSVVDGTDYSLRVCRAGTRERLVFRVRGGRLFCRRAEGREAGGQRSLTWSRDREAGS